MSKLLPEMKGFGVTQISNVLTPPTSMQQDTVTGKTAGLWRKIQTMAEGNRWHFSRSALKAVKKSEPDARIGLVLPGLVICNSLFGPRRPEDWEQSDTVSAMSEAFGHLLRQPSSVNASSHSQAIQLEGPAFSFGKTDSLEITQHSPKDETDEGEAISAQAQPIQPWGVPEPVSRWSSSSDDGGQADLQKM
ncbi:hypothetical protein HOY82DRAFT_645907 [Tuber indicum]|nr:hypothetical protein HOY82DRAFT_645907 [Tuber indicum]